MRVLVVHNRYRSTSPSGEDRVVDQETAALEAAGCSVRRFERLSDEISSMPIPQKLSMPAKIVWNPSAQHALAKAIDSFQPDVVHVHNVYPLMGPSILSPCRGRAPVVLTLHNYRPICPSGQMFRNGSQCSDCVDRSPLSSVVHGCYKGSSLATFPISVATIVQRHLWKSVPSAYIFLSAAQRDTFKSFDLPADRCFVKGNLINPVTIERTKVPLVAYVGRLVETKGIAMLMEAWDRFRRDVPDSELQLAIAGSGPLEDRVRTWAEGDRGVRFLGLLDRDQCAELMASARAVVAPSVWREPFGMVVVEAMASGTPPIAPDHGAFADLVEGGVDGELFPPGDVSDLARLLALVDNDPGYFQKLGEEARGTHSRRFSPEKNVAELLDVYRFAVSHPRGDEAPRPRNRQRAIFTAA
jgi:glycosyltransferase involved in cell wall biosynthesis